MPLKARKSAQHGIKLPLLQRLHVRYNSHIDCYKYCKGNSPGECVSNRACRVNDSAAIFVLE